MDLLVVDKLTSVCPICSNPRTYKTKNGFLKGLIKPCRSCSNSIQVGGVGNIRPVNGEKRCFACLETKPLSNFVKYKDGHYHSYCTECKKVSFRKYQKNIGRFARYNILREDYEKLYIAQGGRCEICKDKFDVLCVDHNHDTNAIRGLLCKQCNVAIGLLKENTDTIKNALLYLNLRGE